MLKNSRPQDTRVYNSHHPSSAYVFTSHFRFVISVRDRECEMLLREHDHVDRLAGGNGRDSSTYRKTPWDLYLYDENSFSSLSLLAPRSS